MALYLGKELLKINSEKKICRLNVSPSSPITNGIRLLSSDNLILKNIKGSYLTVKDGE